MCKCHFNNSDPCLTSSDVTTQSTMSHGKSTRNTQRLCPSVDLFFAIAFHFVKAYSPFV